jgi:hypothetical protein
MGKNLLLIIGNAVADNFFLKELFADPFRTVEKYGFKLTDAERKGLEDLTGAEHGTDNYTFLKNTYICPRKPCLVFMLERPKGFGPPPEPMEQPRTGTEG